MSREEAGARLSRLLVMLPWMASRPDGTTLDELAQRFETTINRVEKDLRLLGEVEPEAHLNVSMYEEDGRWFVDGHGHLAQPFRLTAENAFGLIVAGVVAAGDIPVAVGEEHGVRVDAALLGAVGEGDGCEGAAGGE